MDDPNAHPDKAAMSASFLGIFRRNLSSGEVVLLNRDSSGNVANGNFKSPRINADGTRAIFSASFVGFIDNKKMIASLPGNTGFDLYVKDIPGGNVWGLTETTDGTAHAGAVGTEHAISDSGSVVAFASSSDKLIPGSDAGASRNDFFDVFRADLGPAGAVALTLITKSPTDSGNVNYVNGPFLPGTGNYVAFGTDQLTEMGYEDSFGSHGLGVGNFSTGGSGPLAFADWAMDLPAGERGYFDNPSGDRVGNLVKYFIGSNPALPDLSHLPGKGIATGETLGLPGDFSDYLTISVRIRRDRPAGFAWTVQAAASPADMSSSPLTATQVGGAVADGDFDEFLFRYPTPIDGSGNGYLRLAVTAP